MIALTGTVWAVIAAAAVLYVSTSVRVARSMGRIGRSRTAWFFITLVLTAVPASVVLLRHHRRAAEGWTVDGPACCRHCGALLGSSPDPAPPSAVTECPSCGMKLDEEHLA